MKLSDAASWAEIVSAVDMIISLVCVGVQVTDNSTATRSETASNASSEFIDFYNLVSSDAELAEIWLRGVTDSRALDAIEMVRFVFTLHKVMLQFQNNFYLVQEGTLAPGCSMQSTALLGPFAAPLALRFTGPIASHFSSPNTRIMSKY